MRYLKRPAGDLPKVKAGVRLPGKFCQGGVQSSYWIGKQDESVT
jgi:hypothetical protein